MILILASFATAFFVTMWVVHSGDRHGHLSRDHDLSSPQKFHARPVPRIGGLGIFFGVIAGVFAQHFQEDGAGHLTLMLTGCALPAFGAGFVEDLTKNMSPRRRLFFTAVSAAMAFWLLDAALSRTDIPGVDWVASTMIGSFLITVVMVSGVANSVNIIDGFNGLASMCVVLMLCSMAYVAGQVGDREVMSMALIGVGATLGFFVWNFPAGLIFLGDGGAYFLGFWVAETAILLLARNPQVTPLFALLVAIYPVFETLFSMYRRKWLRGRPVAMPDGVHLHSLIYRRFLRWAAGERTAKELTRRNSMTSPYLWMLCMSSIVPAMLWWHSAAVMGFVILVFAAAYLNLYWRIVRFNAPGLLRRRQSRPMPLEGTDNPRR